MTDKKNSENLSIRYVVKGRIVGFEKEKALLCPDVSNVIKDNGRSYLILLPDAESRNEVEIRPRVVAIEDGKPLKLSFSKGCRIAFAILAGMISSRQCVDMVLEQRMNPGVSLDEREFKLNECEIYSACIK